MIQLSRQALFICHQDGRIEPLDVEHLIRCLARCSQDEIASFDPWIVQHVLESIIYHFRHDLKREKVALGELIELAGRLIRDFLKENACKPTEAPHLDLLDAARRCGAAFELRFFSEIKQFLAATTGPLLESSCLSASNGTGFHKTGKPASVAFTELRRCAKYLCGRRRWSRRCAEMRDEIVAYIRREAVRTGAKNISLAVFS